MKTIKFLLFIMSVSLWVLPTFIFAQSGNRNVPPSPTSDANSVSNDKAKKSSDDQSPAKFQFILSGKFTRYIEELNKFGELGYRVERAFNYGGDAAGSQKFAAVLKLDTEDKFEYDWMTSPNKKFLESRLNFKAERGFSVVQILPMTSCSDKDVENDIELSPVAETLLRLTKGDVFLLERPIGKVEKSKEYKVVFGKIGFGKNPTAEVQNALDNAPTEFQPFKILFNKSGTFDFTVSVLLEKNLKNEAAEKIQYRFFKDVNGFEKQVNSLAQEGFQLIAGRRIGLIKFALLAKVPGDAVSYILLDADKYQKEFAKKVRAANIYKGMFLGDTTCDEPETKGGKLVFAQTADDSQKYEYKFLKLSDKNLYPTDGDSIAKLNKLLAQNYRVRDIFYAEGAVIILEK